MRVSIVIPTYNHYDLLHQVLFDVYNQCKSVYEVVVMNDASTDKEVYTGIQWWQSTKMLNLRHIENSVNQGFLKSSNYGLRVAWGDVKILLSNDVRLYGDIVQDILLALKDEPKSLVGGAVYTDSTGWNKFGKKIFPYAEGWLLGATEEAWEELGYFDEQFVPSDYEDVDLSTKAIQLGYRLVPLKQGLAAHMGGQSIGYTPEREAMTKQHQEVFKNKWILE